MISRRRLSQYIATSWVEKSVPRDQLIEQMAAYLIDARQTRQANLLVNDIKIQLEKQYGVTVANVTSARELTAELKKHIQVMVADKTGADKVQLSEQIDESLIGGAIVDTPTMSIDLSIRGKLNTLRSRL